MTDPTPIRSRGTSCETELKAMVRYARRLEANEVARRSRDGMSDAEIMAAIKSDREQFGVAETMRRLFAERGARGDAG